MSYVEAREIMRNHCRICHYQKVRKVIKSNTYPNKTSLSFNYLLYQCLDRHRISPPSALPHDVPYNLVEHVLIASTKGSHLARQIRDSALAESVELRCG